VRVRAGLVGLGAVHLGLYLTECRTLRREARPRPPTARKPSTRSYEKRRLGLQTARKPSARSRPLRWISSVAPQAPLPRIGPPERRTTGPRPFIPPGPHPHLEPPQPTAVLAHFVRYAPRPSRVRLAASFWFASLTRLGTLGGTRHVVGGSSCEVRNLPRAVPVGPSHLSAGSYPWRTERANLARACVVATVALSERTE